MKYYEVFSIISLLLISKIIYLIITHLIILNMLDIFMLGITIVAGLMFHFLFSFLYYMDTVKGKN